MSRARVEVWRGGMLESLHDVAVAVVDAEGRLRAGAGDAARVVYARSAVKPIQAIPLVADGGLEAFGFSSEELALTCASHSGEPRHVQLARGMLEKVELGIEALACGAHPPFHEESARKLVRTGQEPSPLHNNCSGKHIGMLALARLNCWPITRYHERAHAVQRRMLAEIVEWTGVPSDAVEPAVDGCGVVTFGLPLDRLASAFARLARAMRGPGGLEALPGEGSERWPDSVEDAACRVLRAMRSHPFYVAGTERLCSELTRVTDGRIIAKVGAEGIYCAAAPGAELGIALKVMDGARLAAEPALLAVLRTLGLTTEEEYASLSNFARPSITNTLGQTVGHVRAVMELGSADG